MSSLHFYDKTKGGTVPVSADSPLPISGTFSADPPVGGATEANQDVANTSLDNIDGKLPALDGGRIPVTGTFDAPVGAATEDKQDTGNTSLGSIDTKTPALSGGRVPVVLPNEPGDATADNQTTGNNSLASIDGKLAALDGGRVPVAVPSGLAVQILRRAGVPRQLAAGVATANTVLTASCTAISMRAVGAAVRYAIGTGAQTADATTSHFLADGERMDLAVEANSQIAVIRDDATDAVVELTELI